LVKSVATTSVYLIPIMFLFGFTPYIEFLVTDEGHIARRVAEFFPLYQNLFILNGDGGMAEFLILLSWIAVSFVIVVWAFNKRTSHACSLRAGRCKTQRCSASYFIESAYTYCIMLK